MDVSGRYTKGAGNAALFARARKAGQYWDFVTLAGVNSESANTRVFLSEYPDANDPLQSFYSVTIVDPPNGPWTVEIVEAATGKTLYDGESPTSTTVDIPAIAEAVREKIPAAVIPILQGAVIPPISSATQIVRIKLGETRSIPYDLGADYPGETPWFGARLGVDNPNYAIAPRRVRKVTDRTGFIDLVPADLVVIGNLAGEIELRDDADASKVRKPCEFVLEVRKAIIR